MRTIKKTKYISGILFFGFMSLIINFFGTKLSGSNVTNPGNNFGAPIASADVPVDTSGSSCEGSGGSGSGCEGSSGGE